MATRSPVAQTLLINHLALILQSCRVRRQVSCRQDQKLPTPPPRICPVLPCKRKLAVVVIIFITRISCCGIKLKYLSQRFSCMDFLGLKTEWNPWVRIVKKDIDVLCYNHGLLLFLKISNWNAHLCQSLVSLFSPRHDGGLIYDFLIGMVPAPWTLTNILSCAITWESLMWRDAVPQSSKTVLSWGITCDFPIWRDNVPRTSTNVLSWHATFVM